MIDIKLLGQFDVRVDGRSIAFDSRQAQALIAYLALHAGQLHRREKIAGLLWPETTEKNARNNLRHVVWQINQVLGKTPGAKPLVAGDRINIWLVADLRPYIDVNGLRERPPSLISTETLTSIAASYQDELLPGFYDDWLTPIRESMTLAFAEVMTTLLNRLSAEQRWRDVITWGQHWIAKGQATEHAYCQMMLAYAQLDDAAGLSTVYHSYLGALSRDGEIQPSQTVVNQYHALRRKLAARVNQHLLMDWADAPDARECIGREQELKMLGSWFTHANARIAVVLGIGGIGKTTLAAECARLLQPHFEGVIWRTLRNAPTPRSLIEDWLNTMGSNAARDATGAPARDAAPEVSFGDRLAQFMRELRQHRYILILDNYESLLEGGTSTGAYRVNYEQYADLLRSLAETAHQSCVILTSREKPTELAVLAGDAGPVRVLRLSGVDSEISRDIVRDKALEGSQDQWQELTDAYNGNPLALKIVAEGIREMFGGSIERYLANRPPVFGNVRKLFDEQIDRLPDLEREVMLWLAVERESTTVERLQNDLLLAVPQSLIVEAVRSLRERSLVEITNSGFTLQNVVMEYLTERLIEHAVGEFKRRVPRVLRSHALIKAGATDYVREAQIRLILKPIAEQIDVHISRPKLRSQLADMLDQERANGELRASYLAGNIINLLATFGDVGQMDFSHLEVRQAYLRATRVRDCNFSGARFWHTAFGEQFVGLNAVDMSPNSHHIVIATRDEARIWHTHSAQPHVTLHGHSGFVWNVAFSPDGQLVATASADGTAQVWDVASGDAVQTLIGANHVPESNGSGTPPGVWGLAWSGDGRLLATGDETGTVWLWQTQTGELLQHWRAHAGIVYALTFDRTVSKLVSGGGDGVARVWHVPTGQCQLELPHAPNSEVRACAISRDGTLATGSSDGKLRLWDIGTGDMRGELFESPAGALARVGIPSLSFSRDGDLVACANYDGTVRLWDTRQRRSRPPIRAHAQETRGVALSGDGTTLVSIGYDGAVRLWDARTGRALWTVRGYNQEVRSVAFSPDGRSLVSGSADNNVRVWDVAEGKLVRTLTGHKRWVESVAVSPDSTRVLSGSYDRSIRLWQLQSGQAIGNAVLHDQWVWSVAFSPDGRFVATGGADPRVRLYKTDLAVGVKRTPRMFEGHQRSVSRVTFSADSRLLATASEDCTARIWDVDSGQCVLVCDVFMPVLSIAFGPDSLLLMAVGDVIQFWDTRRGELTDTLPIGVDATAVTTSADGRFAACAANDGVVRVWDVRTRKLQWSFTGHTLPVWSVAMHPQRPIVASGGLDGTIRLWHLDDGHAIATLRADRMYERMTIGDATGLSDAERATLIALGATD